jgi:hypothetical protein
VGRSVDQCQDCGPRRECKGSNMLEVMVGTCCQGIVYVLDVEISNREMPWQMVSWESFRKNVLIVAVKVAVRLTI